jgi:hypothetical protein
MVERNSPGTSRDMVCRHMMYEDEDVMCQDMMYENVVYQNMMFRHMMCLPTQSEIGVCAESRMGLKYEVACYVVDAACSGPIPSQGLCLNCSCDSLPRKNLKAPERRYLAPYPALELVAAATQEEVLVVVVEEEEKEEEQAEEEWKDLLQSLVDFLILQDHGHGMAQRYSFHYSREQAQAIG